MFLRKDIAKEDFYNNVILDDYSKSKVSNVLFKFPMFNLFCLLALGSALLYMNLNSRIYFYDDLKYALIIELGVSLVLFIIGIILVFSKLHVRYKRFTYLIGFYSSLKIQIDLFLSVLVFVGYDYDLLSIFTVAHENYFGRYTKTKVLLWFLLFSLVAHVVAFIKSICILNKEHSGISVSISISAPKVFVNFLGALSGVILALYSIMSVSIEKLFNIDLPLSGDLVFLTFLLVTFIIMITSVKDFFGYCIHLMYTFRFNEYVEDESSLVNESTGYLVKTIINKVRFLFKGIISFTLLFVLFKMCEYFIYN